MDTMNRNNKVHDEQSTNDKSTSWLFFIFVGQIALVVIAIVVYIIYSLFT